MILNDWVLFLLLIFVEGYIFNVAMTLTFICGVLLILTRDDWFPVTVSIYSFIREVGANYNLLMAACLIAIFPVIILYFFTQRLFLESISNFGLKQ